MCGICGVIVYDGKLHKQSFDTMVAITTRRGRDSFGMVALDDHGLYHAKGHLNLDSHTVTGFGVDENTKVAIVQCRAEPTTEFVDKQNRNNVPPFISSDKNWAVAHNGMVANDKELADKYQFKDKLKTTIDSAIIPELLSQVGSTEEIFYELMGSFATAIISKENKTLTLYRDYQPLWYGFCDGAFYFASEEEAIPCEVKYEMQPYTGTILSVEKGMSPLDMSFFYVERREISNKTFIICSGGLDSTTVAALAKKEGKEVILLHFLYKCFAEKEETKAIKEIAKRLNCEYRFIDLSWLSTIGGSTLTCGDTNKIVKDDDGAAGAELCHEWVPARNLIMASLTAGLCDAENVQDVRLGLNLEESGAYCDNTNEFFRKLTEVLQVGTISRAEIKSPLGYLMKHEIVAEALRVGAPIDISYSCYEGNQLHCGKCGPCFMRRTAFKMNKIIDPMIYSEVDVSFWDGCKKHPDYDYSAFDQWNYGISDNDR